jgi:hypothetical protein
MYCVVFSGRLLEGHDPRVVRKAVAGRLSLDSQQVERLFSGKRVILKKGVTEESGRLYLGVLRRLGMDAGIARVPQVAKTVQALATFKVVFWGRVLDGFDRKTVMQAAAARLRASPEQVARMFNGDGKVVIKRGVSSELGSRYVLELGQMGMQIELEVEVVETVPEVRLPAVDPTPLAKAAGLRSRGGPVGYRRYEDEDFEGLLQTQFDLPPSSDVLEEAAMGRPLVVAPKSALRESSYAAALAVNAAGTGRNQQRPRLVQTQPIAYLRCTQCGHRQVADGVHCRVCGADLVHLPQRGKIPIPMDASAFSTPTTLLANLPPSLMRGGIGTSAPAVPGKIRQGLEDRAQGIRGRQEWLRRLAPALIGAAVSLSVMGWLAVRILGR